MRERSACAHSAQSKRSRWTIGALSVALFAVGWAVPVTANARAEDDVKVRGQVLDPGGKPLAGAKLYLGGFTRSSEAKYPSRATSDNDGRFEFRFKTSELGKGDSEEPTYQVLAVAEGYGCAWVRVDAAAKELTLRLVKDAPVSGRILDTDGKPVTGARLTVTGVAAAKGGDAGWFAEWVRSGQLKYAYGMGWVGPLPGQPQVLTTGADGGFKVSGVGPDLAVAFRLEGRGIATAAVGAYGEKFEYQAAVSRPIRGVVRDKDTGKPMAGVAVSSGGYTDSPRAVTDKEGRYELLGVAKAPRYTLAVKPANDQLYFQRSVTVEDQPGLEPQTADVEMVHGLTVRGKVSDKATGKPVAGALVDYYPLYANPNVNKLPGTWHPRSEATTGADGAYALTVLPGAGVIGVTGPDPRRYMPAFLAPKEWKGFFKTPVFDANELLWAVGGNYSDGIASEEAWHALVLLEPGENEEVLGVDLELERPLERTGQVVGPDGKPLTGAMVFGLAPRGTDAEILKRAEFTVRGINPKAPRQLVLYHKEKNLGLFLKELPSEKDGPLTVKLEACGEATGRMVDSDGQEVVGMRLDFPGTGPVVGPYAGAVHVPHQAVTTDKEGRFRVAGLVPGYRYHVTGQPPGVKPWQSVGFWLIVQPGEKKDMGEVQVGKKR